jgi:hypothetical protein
MDRMPLGLDELVEHWTVLEDERKLIAGKRGPTRLGFAVLLKFFTQRGRLPSGRSELPDEAIEFVARQVRAPASDMGFYEWSGSTIEYHRAQIREHLGFRECSVVDQDKLTDWLAANVAHAERNPDVVRAELYRRCRAERIEPPTPPRVTRAVRSALHNAEETWFCVIASRISADAASRVLALIGDPARNDEDGDEEGEEQLAAEEEEDQDSVLALVKTVPGNVSLESMLTEIRKLQAIRAIGLPPGLFADVAPKVLAGWRARAAVESPSHLRRRLKNTPQNTITLLAALLAEREREVTDSLVDLLIATVHRIGARAERKVTEELINAFRRVTGKENILFSIAEASLARPSEAVREVVFPAVQGGEATLPHAPGRPRRRGMGQAARPRRPARPDPAVLVARPALRRGPPQHGLAPPDRKPGRGRPVTRPAGRVLRGRAGCRPRAIPRLPARKGMSQSGRPGQKAPEPVSCAAATGRAVQGSRSATLAARAVTLSSDRRSRAGLRSCRRISVTAAMPSERLASASACLWRRWPVQCWLTGQGCPQTGAELEVPPLFGQDDEVLLAEGVIKHPPQAADRSGNVLEGLRTGEFREFIERCAQRQRFVLPGQREVDRSAREVGRGGLRVGGRRCDRAVPVGARVRADRLE